nr:MAG TPA: hypothetical protein [Bacteriophage sp.]
MTAKRYKVTKSKRKSKRKSKKQSERIGGKTCVFTHSRREDANASPPPLLKGGKRNAF